MSIVSKINIPFIVVLIFLLTSCATSPTLSNNINPETFGRDRRAEKSSCKFDAARCHSEEQSDEESPAVPVSFGQSVPMMTLHSEELRNKKADISNQESAVGYQEPAIIDNDSVSINNKPITEDALIKKELKRLMLEFGEDTDVPQVFLNEVQSYITLFRSNSKYRKFVSSSLEKSTKYMPMVKGLLGKKGIPGDMAYIAFIESGFNPEAKSHAGAVGMWQFMPGTARDYSLQVNWKRDERRDPVKSTYAAIDYFQDLLSIFGSRSFLLAMAAYNGGEGKVMSCLKKIDNPLEQRSFWHIRPCLAKETKEYPPKIIASAIIGNNPEVFGFLKYDNKPNGTILVADDENRPDKKKTSYKTIETEKEKRNAKPRKAVYKKKKPISAKKEPVIYTVKKGNSLFSIARAFEVKAADIKKWNSLKGKRIMEGQKLSIYLSGTVARVKYSVRKGDTISGIAKKFKVQPESIITLNGIRSTWRIRTGQRLMFYKRIKRPYTYTVKKGTTLTYISEAFKVSIEDIIEWNGLDSTIIHQGQTLKIYPHGLREI